MQPETYTLVEMHNLPLSKRFEYAAYWQRQLEDDKKLEVAFPNSKGGETWHDLNNTIGQSVMLGFLHRFKN